MVRTFIKTPHFRSPFSTLLGPPLLLLSSEAGAASVAVDNEGATANKVRPKSKMWRKRNRAGFQSVMSKRARKARQEEGVDQTDRIQEQDFGPLTASTENSHILVSLYPRVMGDRRKSQNRAFKGHRAYQLSFRSVGKLSSVSHRSTAAWAKIS